MAPLLAGLSFEKNKENENWVEFDDNLEYKIPDLKFGDSFLKNFLIPAEKIGDPPFFFNCL